MAQMSFSPEWLTQFSDPYAVLGLSVAADDRRVLKRYRSVAKLLHPDSFAAADSTTKQVANQILARLVNPAYQRLKQEKERTETLTTLRFRARRINQEEPLLPKSVLARRLMQTPLQELEIFYEQSVDALAEQQFAPLVQFPTIAEQLAELNLLYLYLKAGDPLREKRTGLVSATQARPPQFTPPAAETAQMASSYAQRHYQRAQVYLQKGNLAQAIVELRDAIRLEAQKSEYHSLLAKAYLMQNLPGMAKVHFRQALKFNPNDALALEYAARLNLVPEQPSKAQNSSGTPAKSSGGFFGLFARKR